MFTPFPIPLPSGWNPGMIVSNLGPCGWQHHLKMSQQPERRGLGPSPMNSQIRATLGAAHLYDKLNVSVSHMPLLSWVSIICSHIYILLYLSIGQVICLDEFCIFQLTNTSDRRHLQTQAVMEWWIIIRIIIMSTSVSGPMVCMLLRGHRSLKSTKSLSGEASVGLFLDPTLHCFFLLPAWAAWVQTPGLSEVGEFE